MKYDYRRIRKGFTVFVTLLLLLTPITSAQLITSYSYDPNGNMVSDGAYCYTYNDANQLSKAKNCSNNQLIAEYSYDHTGQRAIKKQYNGGVLKYTVYYIGKNYETKIYANGTVENTSYYFANGERVASKDKKGVTYYHSDHLGSASVLTNAAGALIEETTYLPFGAIKSGGNKSKYLYTGQENDPETGLYYYGARYYDPELMRFAQADPVIQDHYDPQSLNRYSYVKNNPLRYTDPTGNAVVILGVVLVMPMFALIVGVGLVSYAVYIYVTPPEQRDPIKAVSGAILDSSAAALGYVIAPFAVASSAGYRYLAQPLWRIMTANVAAAAVQETAENTLDTVTGAAKSEDIGKDVPAVAAGAVISSLMGSLIPGGPKGGQFISNKLSGILGTKTGRAMLGQDLIGAAIDKTISSVVDMMKGIFESKESGSEQTDEGGACVATPEKDIWPPAAKIKRTLSLDATNLPVSAGVNNPQMSHLVITPDTPDPEYRYL